MRRALWTIAMVALLVSLPFTGLANGDDSEKQITGFGFGGPMIGLFTLDLAEMNEVLENNDYAPLAEQLITFGGGGGGGVIGGFSFGGTGWGGSLTSHQEGKKAELSLGFGGMDVAYVVGGNERSLLSIGVVLGGGEVDLKLRDHFPVSFEDAVANPTTTTLSRGFLSAEPYIRFQVQPLMWLGLKLHLGYLFTLPGGWEEGGQEISGLSLNLTGPFVGISIAFGGIGTAEVKEIVEDVLEEALGETEFDEATCAAIKAFYEKRCGGELEPSAEEETNAALVQDTLLAMSVGDLDTLEPLLAEDISWVSPEGLLPWSGTWVGKDAFLAGLAAATEAEASLKIDRVFTSEDEVSVKWHLSPAEEGGEIVYGVTVFRIDEGKILSGRDYGN